MVSFNKYTQAPLLLPKFDEAFCHGACGQYMGTESEKFLDHMIEQANKRGEEVDLQNLAQTALGVGFLEGIKFAYTLANENGKRVLR